MLNFVDNCKEGTFCNKLRTYLFWLDLATVSADLFTEKMMRQSARNAYKESKITKIDKELEKHLEDVGYSTFNSKADPVADLLGPGIKSHPERWYSILSELNKFNIKVLLKDKEVLAYSPGFRKGMPGQLTIYKETSISALEHEYNHFLDDKASGFLGMEGLFDANFRIGTEINSYMIEIKMDESFQTRKNYYEA